MTGTLTRADRRRLEREDEKWIGKPLALGAGIRSFEANVRHVMGILRNTREPARATNAAAFVQTLYERTIASLKPSAVACAKGCSFCCHTFVTIIPPEAFRVAAVVRKRGDALCEKVAHVNEVTASADRGERWKTNTPCALLDADICTVHDIRPLTCRGCVSTSADKCFRIYREGAHEMPSITLEYNSACTATAAVLSAALSLAGLPYRSVEWNGALAAAVALPDAEARWLAGEDIFSAVARGVGTAVGTPFDGMVEELVTKVRPTI